MERIGNWLDERLGLARVWRTIFHRHVPVGLNWMYTLGAATLFVIALQVTTGILLALNYSDSPDHAYDSVLYITNSIPFGWIIRSLHHWGASALVVLLVLHMVTAFGLGAYKAPREATWMVGVLLLVICLGFGFTGYLLPWDQKAYWATTVGTNIPGAAPLIGAWLVELLRGGTEVGTVTLARFYAAHVLIFPAILAFLLFVHLALVIWHGVSVPPVLWFKGLRGWNKGQLDHDPDVTPALDPLVTPKPLDAEQYHKRYAAFKARGPRFWPEVIGDDTKFMLLVFIVLIGLTVVLGVSSEARADPTDTAYIPRPEWYFMFLFQLLKYFPGSVEWLGVLVLPGLAIAVLFLVPFFSRGEERRLRYRPIGGGIMAVVLVGIVGLTVQAFVTTPPTVLVEHGVALTSQQLLGRQLIDQQGCRSCHIINGQGETKGPSLDGIGQRLTAADIHFYMENPKAYNPAASMTPLIPPLSHEDVEAITQYLLTLPPDTTQAKGGSN